MAPEVLGIHEHRAEGTPDPLPENPDIEGMNGVALEGEDTLFHTAMAHQLLPGDPHQVEPPVEDHGHKMINRVKQEMDNHNNLINQHRHFFLNLKNIKITTPLTNPNKYFTANKLHIS